MHSIETLGVAKADRGDVRVEHLENRLAPKVPFPHKHDFYQLVILKAGKGWHEVDFERYAAESNQIYIIKPGQVHGWSFAKATRGFTVEFTVESLKDASLVQQLDELPDFYRWDKKSATFSFEFLEMMEKESREQLAESRTVLQNCLEILLLQVFRLTKASKKRETLRDDFNRRFAELVEKNYRAEHNLEFYAEQLNVSPKSLSARIQRVVGKPAKEIIQDRCLLEARRLLIYSPLSVSEIGYELGFEDPNYFSRFLKQRLKMSALQFRERNKN